MGDIPTVETYRGVGIHNHQPQERIEKVVKPAIDYVLDLGQLELLAQYAGDVTRPPEARLLALAKCEAIFDLAVSERRERPAINMEQVIASAHSAGSNAWRDRRYYCSMLDVRGPALLGCPQPVRRETPLPDA